MAQPDYLVCLECESPVYVFEWQDGRLGEVVCPVCGNDDPASFATEEELEEMDAGEAADEDEGFEP
jgi:uncharacterized Zn finger protein (UPF0148 family)